MCLDVHSVDHLADGSWYDRMTLKEKRLVVALAIVGLIAFVLLIVVIVLGVKLNRK